MIIKNALRFLSIAMTLSWPATSLAQQSKVIELVATDGGSKIASIHLNDQNLLFEPSDTSHSFLFSSEAFFTINHKDKSYTVQRCGELKELATRKASEMAKTQEGMPVGPDIGLKLTQEADTISGLRARKIIQMNGGNPGGEIWVCSELLPVKLRAAGEELRSVLREDYWKKVHGSAGLVEIILLYGIPLKIVHDGHSVCQARVLEVSSSSTSFQVPSGYRKVAN